MTDLKHKILTAVHPDFKAIEAALAEHLNPHFDLVQKVAGHILFAGGKRLRPLLMILSARLCRYRGAQEVKFSIIFEYLHAATLLHDDVVDGGALRRGLRAAHQVWDPPTAVLTGDFLLARALALAAQTGMPEVIDTIAAITEQMSQGEIEQMARMGDLSLSETEYRDVIRCKTAVLFQGACRTGALISRVDASRVQALGDYGHHLGMAFQMADDLLDYTLDSLALGKKVGADLREGKMTLPVIHALAHSEAADRRWLVRLIESRKFTSAEFKRLIALLDKSRSLVYTRECARDHIDQAKRALSGFPAGFENGVLADIADYALVRTA